MKGKRNILVVAIAIVLNLVVSEIVLYNFFPQPVYAIKYSPWGWEHIPNISFKYVPESKESVSYVRYNSDGFRGPDEYMTPAPDGTLRIAILGDSEAEGNVVPPATYDDSNRPRSTAEFVNKKRFEKRGGLRWNRNNPSHNPRKKQ